MIKFEKITKKFGGITALSEATFTIEKGEFVFVSGPSGSGKTTLLKLILGELKPSSGKINVFDYDLVKIKDSDLPKFRQHIGVVFQDFKILPEKTVSENVEIALAVVGVSQKLWTERVEHVLKLVNLSRQINKFPNQLSGGEMQRLALARALVVNPDLILADEPTGNLDWKISIEIMDLLEKINKEGKTVLVVSHNQEIVKKYKKRIIKIENGKILK
jgi:cell division transport system ATP-binding protein